MFCGIFCTKFFDYFRKSKQEMIQFLKHNEIDKQKWDDSISSSSSKIVYALSWYLDCVSPNWCALIEDDYKTCMPLPIKPKWGIPLITQPFACQQLGVFFTKRSIMTDLNLWIRAIPRKYPLIRLSMNIENSKNYLRKQKLRKNYILDLSKSYIEICKEFTKHTKRNITKAQKNMLEIKEIKIDEAFAFLKKNNSIFNTHDFKNIFSTIEHQNKLQIFATISNEDYISIAFFIKSFSSYIYLASCTNEIGRNLRANYFLIDLFIKVHCNTNSTLDFEGSSIESIAKFYAGFGAKKYEFMKIKIWNLSISNTILNNL